MKKVVVGALAHTKWNGKHPIVCVPKYSRKAFIEVKRPERWKPLGG